MGVISTIARALVGVCVCVNGQPPRLQEAPAPPPHATPVDPLASFEDIQVTVMGGSGGPDGEGEADHVALVPFK